MYIATSTLKSKGIYAAYNKPILSYTQPSYITYSTLSVVLALRSDCQGLTLPPYQSPTVDTTYFDVVLIACHETSQFMLCDSGSGDVQKSPIWDLGSISGNVDEVGISTVSTTQSPAHSDIHRSTDISKEVNTREGGDRGGTWRN